MRSQNKIWESTNNRPPKSWGGGGGARGGGGGGGGGCGWSQGWRGWGDVGGAMGGARGGGDGGMWVEPGVEDVGGARGGGMWVEPGVEGVGGCGWSQGRRGWGMWVGPHHFPLPQSASLQFPQISKLTRDQLPSYADVLKLSRQVMHSSRLLKGLGIGM